MLHRERSGHRRWTRKDGTPTIRHGTGLRWLARFVDAQGQEHSKAFPRKVDARQWLSDGHVRTLSTVCIDNLGGCFVYVLWGNSPTTPLYVGATTTLLYRLGQHMRDTDKRGARRVQIIGCPDAAEMSVLEHRLIDQYRPTLNRVFRAP
jgi:hypothetical protein